MTQHALMMSEYYSLVQSWEYQAELVTNNFAAELAEYCETNPRPTFREFLIGYYRGR